MRNREAIVQQLSGTARQVEVPAPFGGLNARDSRAAMAPQDALQLTNLVSEPGGVKSRLGHAEWGTGMTGIVNFIAEFINGTTRKMLVGAGTVVYDFSINGGTANSVQTGFTNSDFESAMLSGSMVIVNGADAPEIYGGSTLTTAIYSGDIATPGADTMDAISTHKSRMYLWDTDTGDFYYGSTNAIQGAFTKFDLSQVSTTGGNLLMMQTISRDGGDGPDDYAAFILNTGEVLIYDGNDPGTAANWSLIGRFFIPPPINKRSSQKFAGDVLVLTQQDVISLLDVMKLGFEGQGAILEPTKLSGAIDSEYSVFGINDGWQLTVYGKRGWAIVNIPETTDSTYRQYINVLPTAAPAKFSGWNGTVFGVYNNNLFFGGDGVVNQADIGFDDDGANIQCRGQQAFSTFGIPNVKNVRNVTITYLFNGSATLGAEVAYDYVDKTVENQATSETTGAEWDFAEWDTSEWAGATEVRNVKFSAAGTGRAASIIISFDIKGAQFTWLGSSLSMELQSMI